MMTAIAVTTMNTVVKGHVVTWQLSPVAMT